MIQHVVELFTLYRKSIIMGIGLQVCSQLMGINTLMYYGPTVITKIHFSSNTSPTFPIKTYVPMAAIYTFR